MNDNASHSRRVRIALTMGDPAGIGPELAVRAVASGQWNSRAEFICYGDEAWLRQEGTKFALGTPLDIRATRPVGCDFARGVAAAECGLAAYDAVKQATLDAIAGRVDAIVTAPMNKCAVNLAGIEFSGHTEFIAGLCGIDDEAMMQSAGNLRVIFVTTHIGIAEVANHVTEARICRVTRLLDEAVRAEKSGLPHLACAALNPHAGENGFMGREDEEVTKPALAKLRAEGYDIEGPFPPDTLFIPGTLEKFDGIVSMYHDQGHIPFKMLAFDRGVNSTMGLPIIRTSPDHGTAFEIAGKGVADPGSFYAAIETAVKRAERKKGMSR